MGRRAAARRNRVSLSLVVPVLVLGALLAGTSAYGAYPGGNGRIAFESSRDGNLEIYSMNPDGSGQTNLTNDPAEDTDPVWSPDGTGSPS